MTLFTEHKPLGESYWHQFLGLLTIDNLMALVDFVIRFSIVWSLCQLLVKVDGVLHLTVTQYVSLAILIGSVTAMAETRLKGWK